MAITATRVQSAHVPGDLVYTITEIKCSTKYVAEGEAVTAADLGLRTLSFAFPLGISDDGEGTVNIANAYFKVTSPTAGKLILRDETPGEVANEAEIKAPTIEILAFGKP